MVKFYLRGLYMKKFTLAAFLLLFSTTFSIGEEFSIERQGAGDFINYKTYEHAEQLVGQSSNIIQGRVSYEFTVVYRRQLWSCIIGYTETGVPKCERATKLKPMFALNP